MPDISASYGRNISVVIPTMNRSEDLARLAASLIKQTCLPKEVIIVDQSLNQKTKEIVAKLENEFPEFGWRYFYQQEKSLVRARNRGLKESSGEIISFLDDDVELDKNYICCVQESFQINKDIGGVAGNVVVPKALKGSKWVLRKALMRLFLLSNFDARMTASGFGYPIFEREISRELEVELFPGNSMNYRSDIARKELSDEWFSGYGFREDVDLSYRISRHAKLIMIPGARFIHNASGVNRLDVMRLKRMELQNYWYIFKKHKDHGLQSRLLFGYSVLGMVLIDLFECILTLKKERFIKAVATLSGILALVRQRRQSVPELG